MNVTSGHLPDVAVPQDTGHTADTSPMITYHFSFDTPTSADYRDELVGLVDEICDGVDMAQWQIDAIEHVDDRTIAILVYEGSAGDAAREAQGLVEFFEDEGFPCDDLEAAFEPAL